MPYRYEYEKPKVQKLSVSRANKLKRILNQREKKRYSRPSVSFKTDKQLRKEKRIERAQTRSLLRSERRAVYNNISRGASFLFLFFLIIFGCGFISYVLGGETDKFSTMSVLSFLRDWTNAIDLKSVFGSEGLLSGIPIPWLRNLIAPFAFIGVCVVNLVLFITGIFGFLFS